MKKQVLHSLPVLLLLALTTVAYADGRKLEAETHAYSINGEVATSIIFRNTASTPRKIWWLSYDGQRKFYKKLAPQESYVQSTYLTHPWLVTDDDGNALTIHYPDLKPRYLDVE